MYIRINVNVHICLYIHIVLYICINVHILLYIYTYAHKFLLMHMHMSCYHFLRQNTRDKAMFFQSTSKTCFSQLGDHTWYICVCVLYNIYIIYNIYNIIYICEQLNPCSGYIKASRLIAKYLCVSVCPAFQ